MIDPDLNNDQLLLRLINNELSEEELRELSTHEDFLKFRAILEESGSWTLPGLETADSYDRLKGKRTPTRSLSWYQTSLFKVAASVVIAMCIVFYLLTSDSIVTYETAQAETEEITLPDNSTVVLGASSILTYDKDTWEISRDINLNGTAYFEVVEGNPFNVNFDLGTVEVLGTGFEIKSYRDYAAVRCFNGEVIVRSADKSVAISRGHGLKIDQNQEVTPFEFPDHEWSADVVRFYEAPLSVVFKSLESQFGIAVSTGDVDLTRKYSGSYTTRDIDTALNMVCEPMNIGFNRDQNSVTLR